MATAQTIIKRCGGPKAVADWLRIDRSTVQRWIGEGRIPEKRWAPLIIAARIGGVEIALDELIPAAAKEAARQNGAKRKAAA